MKHIAQREARPEYIEALERMFEEDGRAGRQNVTPYFPYSMYKKHPRKFPTGFEMTYADPAKSLADEVREEIMRGLFE